MKQVVRKNLYRMMAVMSASAAFLFAGAQETAPTTSGVDAVWWLIIGVGAVLLVAILMLSNVLLNLARLTMEKAKSSKGVTTLLLLLVAGFAQAQETAPSASTPAVFTDWNLIMAATVIALEIFVVIVMVWRIQIMLSELSGKKAEKKTIEIHLPKFFDAINKAVPIEREKDVLLDHNYDGIRELDNDLPPWWKYGFYFTIVFAVVYLAYYHVGGGPSSEDEYVAEMQQAKIEVDAYMKKNALNVDENTVTMADASGIANGKEIFNTNCATCHGNLAEGNAVGPNLTDDYWIHGGSMGDVFKSVKYGWPAKGMKSWQTDLTPVQIKEVVSYIKSLHGSNPPNARAPQGELYSEGGVPTASTDSTTTAAK